MDKSVFLVVGATGHVGSQVAIQLADAGCDVTALVRKKGSMIRDPYQRVIKYLVGELQDQALLRRAVSGVDVVVSTANGMVLVQKHGLMIALGGPDHGTPMIATRDVSQMLVAGALYEGTDNLLIKAGGPQWLTWREISKIISQKTGREKIGIIPLPSWIPRLNQILARPFSASVANTFALMSFVADYQPRWTPEHAINVLKLKPLMTLSDYLDANYQPIKQVAIQPIKETVK